jgi:hypothetical protein
MPWGTSSTVYPSYYIISIIKTIKAMNGAISGKGDIGVVDKIKATYRIRNKRNLIKHSFVIRMNFSQAHTTFLLPGA